MPEDNWNFFEALASFPAYASAFGWQPDAGWVESFSDESVNVGNFLVSAAITVAVFQQGTNTFWLEANGNGFAALPNGTLTSGTIESLTVRNGAGDIVVELSGFVPVDAPAFQAALASNDGATIYEALTALFDTDSVIMGSAVANRAVAGAGNDAATMGDGDDVIVKYEAGDLTYYGGEGSDWLSFASGGPDPYPNVPIQQLVVDLGAGTGTNPHGGTLVLQDVENIIGTDEADVITGSEAANTIGDAANETAGDTISALGGDDAIGFFSLAGFIPELDGAVIDGGTGTDTLVFQYDQAGNVLDLTDQNNNAGMFRDSTISNIERFVVGESLATGFGDLDFRGDGNANFLAVRQGDITVDLAGGNDTLQLLSSAVSTGDEVDLEGGAGNDRLIITPNGNPNILDLVNQANNAGALLGVTVGGFEIYELTPVESALDFEAWRFEFRGSASPETVFGGDRDDTLIGRAGADTLAGNRGGDLYVYSAGDGNDTIVDIGRATSPGAPGESETDTLELVDLDLADVALSRNGNDLLVGIIATGEQIRVTDHFLGGARGLERIELEDETLDRQGILDNLVGGASNGSPTVGGILTNFGLEDSGIAVVNLLSGAVDPDGDTLHVANVDGLGPGMTLVGDSLHVDRSHPAFQDINNNGMRNFQITYDIVDGEGGSVGQRVHVRVTGVNDTATIAGERAGTVSEDEILEVVGFLDAVDVDVNAGGLSEARFQTLSNVEGTYGTFNLVSANGGTWVYELDNASAEVQTLGPASFVTDTMVVQSTDGTSSSVTVTIQGAAEADDDVSAGGPSADSINGYGGADTLTGGGSDDELFGGNGRDILDGGSGNDTVFGGVGDDILVDCMIGTQAPSAGNDTLHGDDGNDYLDGAQGHDLLFGGNDADFMHGGEGDDVLYGGSGNDLLIGGAGNDTVRGDAGSDTLIGGVGKDVFVITEDGGDASILDWRQGDLIDVTALELSSFGDLAISMLDGIMRLTAPGGLEIAIFVGDASPGNEDFLINP